jgi:hypothetical protein
LEGSKTLLIAFYKAAQPPTGRTRKPDGIGKMILTQLFKTLCCKRRRGLPPLLIRNAREGPESLVHASIPFEEASNNFGSTLIKALILCLPTPEVVGQDHR